MREDELKRGGWGGRERLIYGKNMERIREE